MRRGVLFAIGFGIGGLMFLIGGVNWQPPASSCAVCTAVHPSTHRSRCTETAEGEWICEAP